MLRRHLPPGTLTAKLNRNPVPVGETFVLSLEYEGDPGSEKPDFSPLNRDFTVYMVSNSYKGIYTNGKMKKLYIWNVTMAADRTGAFTIPPLSVGKAESRPITLKVVAADGLPPAKDGKPAAPKFSVSRASAIPIRWFSSKSTTPLKLPPKRPCRATPRSF